MRLRMSVIERRASATPVQWVSCGRCPPGGPHVRLVSFQAKDLRPDENLILMMIAAAQAASWRPHPIAMRCRRVFLSAKLADSFAGLLAGFERFPELMLVFCSYAYAMTSMGVVSSAGRGRSCLFAARRDIHGSPEPFLLSLVSGNVSSPGHARGVGETHAGQTGPPQGGGSALPKLQHRA